MSTVMITGDRGFISGYLIEQLLDYGHNVVGIDNDWKYGPHTSGRYTQQFHCPIKRGGPRKCPESPSKYQIR